MSINLSELFYQKLHWCCGKPEQVLYSIYEVLKQVENPDTNKRLNCYESGYTQFMWHALNDADLIEHGSGISGSWLTPMGKELIDLIEKHGVEEVCNEDGQLWWEWRN